MTQSPSASMQLDVLGAKPGEDLLEYCPRLKDIRCFVDYLKDPDPVIDKYKLIAYVVLLYSKDSILNRKPMEDLPNRRLKAARLAGLDAENEDVIHRVFELGQTEEKKTKTDENGKEYIETTYKDRISDLVCSYIIYQGHYDWSDRVAIEAQMDENLRIRLKSIESTKGDKDIIEASTKKYLLTDHFSEYKAKLKKLDSEIFTDHENVKEKTKRKRVTLEGMV